MRSPPGGDVGHLELSLNGRDCCGTSPARLSGSSGLAQLKGESASRSHAARCRRAAMDVHLRARGRRRSTVSRVLRASPDCTGDHPSPRTHLLNVYFDIAAGVRVVLVRDERSCL